MESDRDLFRLDSLVARGTMASVWRGRHRNGNPIAIKFLTAHNARDPLFRQALIDEVQATAALNHPNVLRVLDYGRLSADHPALSSLDLPADTPYLLSEWAQGGALHERTPPVDWPTVRDYLTALLSALGHAHARGLIHRDLKPANLLIQLHEAGPTLKLADFGIAHAIENTQIAGDVLSWGTPTYMAPEQFLGEWRDFGPWTDLYALGCLVFEWVSGAPPFKEVSPIAYTYAHLHKDPPPLVPRFPVPDGLAQWLQATLAKGIGRRFQSAAEAGYALQCLDGHAAADSPPERGAFLPPLTPPIPVSPPRLEETTFTADTDTTGLGVFSYREVPLVGRVDERRALWDALRLAIEHRQPRAVVLHGPAGTGKSRLARTLGEQAHETLGASVFRATHHPGRSGAYHGMESMVRRKCRAIGLDHASVIQNLNHFKIMRPWMNEALSRDLQRFFDVEVPLSPSERHQIVIRLIEGVAAQRPVVLWLDDVQWGLEALTVTHQILERVHAPVLVVLTARDEALPAESPEFAALQALNRSPRVTGLQVGPLPQADRATLIRRILGLAPQLAAQVETRTAGNPLFATQLIADWIDRNLLRTGRHGFELVEGAHEAASLPEDLHQVWRERVTAILEPMGNDQIALELAAVLGQTVFATEWDTACRLAGLTPREDLWTELTRVHLAVREENGWSFVHGMLRESLERIAREQGRWSHFNRICAAVLQPAYERGERGTAARLGLYLAETEEPLDALEPLLCGANEMRESSDYQRGHALLNAREAIIERQELAQPAHFPGWILRSRICLHQGLVDEASSWAVRVVDACRRHEGAQDRKERVEALRLLGDAARRRGDLSRAAELYESVTVLKEAADPHALAAGSWGLGDVLRQQGHFARALELLEDSLRLYRTIGDDHGVADVWVGRGDVARQRREWDRAGAAYSEAEAIFGARGNRYGVARTQNARGDLARLNGDFDLAERLYVASLTTLTTIDSAEALYPRLNLALNAVARINPKEASKRLHLLKLDLARKSWTGLIAYADLIGAWCQLVGGQGEVANRIERAAAYFHRHSISDPDALFMFEHLASVATPESALTQPIAEAIAFQKRDLGSQKSP
ncbi:serine/threonine-protein kinase [Sulfidibacter corallicola]|uniref:Protein kinase n=1 Tax=Sulfidibacter corallicola TaxID=2818388 RepID=A0A8A4TQ91_SULCO|nr:protein kinase [Sulfidibacter corallicola]QTD48725.1 protein kinase [Sulfidibacter corallicola]